MSVLPRRLRATISRLDDKFLPHSAAGSYLRTGLDPVRRRATFRRALGLLADFRFEQSDPDRFYGHLADDTVELIRGLWVGAHTTAEGDNDPTAAPLPTDKPLRGTRIADIGGGPGYFGRAFDAEDATYISIEPDVGEMAAANITLSSSVRGSGLELPFCDGAFDITYSSNVAEHVAEPWRMGAEMLRVTRPGGIVIFSYTCWLGPFGGHETGLWPHYVGGEFAARRYRDKHGHEPKNRWGESLFDVGCADGLAWADAQVKAGAAELVGAFPRYHPSWAWWCVSIPGFRELAASNLVVVLRKLPEDPIPLSS